MQGVACDRNAHIVSDWRVMASNVLKEFLIAIGWKIDDQGYKNFQSKFKSTVEQFERLGKLAVVSGTAMSVALVKVASDMEKLYFSSQRAGTTVGGLMGLRLAAEQIGVGAEAATAALEGMASAIRLNPGLQIFLGLKPTGDSSKDVMNLLAKLKELSDKGPMGHAVAARMAQMFGIDEPTLFMLIKNYAKLNEEQEKFRKRALLAGIDPDKLGEKFNEFMIKVRDLLSTLQLIGYSGFGKILPWAEKFVDMLQRAADWMLKLGDRTDKWSSAIASVGTVLGGLVGAKGILSAIARMFGAGGAAAGGEAAAAGAGGASILGPLALAAADVGLAAFDIKEGAKLYRTYQASGTFKDMGSSLKSMIRHMEGFVSTVTPDIAGNPTIGFGHKVLRGEHFGNISREEAGQLMARDLNVARDAVLRLVKVPITNNQMMALTDFAFNVGQGNFAGSTLLKKLNAGDYAGAAAQFEQWNKAGGMVRGGLTNRRLGEESMFMKPDVNMNQATTIHVNGTDDPKTTSELVANQQRQVNADLLRDMGAKVQ